MNPEIRKGDALELTLAFEHRPDLIVTDPPYAFGGSGAEHELSATVAVTLREAAQKLNKGSWMLVFAASSWRSTSYMVDALRGVVDPVRIGTWTKPESRTKVATSGWKWASVNVIAFRKGKAREIEASSWLDHVCEAPIKNGRRAELPPGVADWAVEPFAVPDGIFLDPFAGSGALPFAAIRAGMRAFGFERNPLETTVCRCETPRIDVYGRCRCGGQVYRTQAYNARVLAARLAEGERATQRWCCQDGGDCLCEDAA